MARRTNVFLKESVIFFGFLNGLWLAIGVNPGAAILDLVRGIVENLAGGSGWVDLVFTLLPLLLVGAALYLIHKRGGWLGFVAVGVAFFAGMLLLAAPKSAALLMLGAILLGIVATR